MLWLLALPVALLRLWLKGRKLPAYRSHIGERLGCYAAPITSRPVWVHAVSVGETRAAEPLVRGLLALDQKVLLTHMTPTGRATGAEIFAAEIAAGRVQQVYLAYDSLFTLPRFFKFIRPKIGLIMETEVWPEMLVQAKRFGIPMFLSNARLSDKSAKRFRFFGNIASEILKSFDTIFAQTQHDLRNLRSLGLDRIKVMGNMKFDVKPNKDMIESAIQVRQALGEPLLIICAASTRDEEEAMILKAWQQCCQQMGSQAASYRLLIVPRHPQRFDLVYEQMQALGDSVGRRADAKDNYALAQLLQAHRLVLGNTMGEMALYYGIADLVIMGGTLKPHGGQNFIEAAALARPVILGPHCFNFQEASRDLIAAEGAVSLENPEDLGVALCELLQNPQRLEKLGSNAFEFANQHIGASQKTLDALSSYLKQN